MTVSGTDGVLVTVKKLLGINDEDKTFDVDVLLNINSALFVLQQLGVVPENVIVTSEDTFDDLLKDHSDMLGPFAMYLTHKTQLGFDPPSSTSVLEALKEKIKELEWRMNVEVDPKISK